MKLGKKIEMWLFYASKLYGVVWLYHTAFQDQIIFYNFYYNLLEWLIVSGEQLFAHKPFFFCSQLIILELWHKNCVHTFSFIPCRLMMCSFYVGQISFYCA